MRTDTLNFSRYALREVLQEQITGEWGTDCDDNAGINVLRTTNFTAFGYIDYSKVVKRNIDSNKVEKKRLREGDIILEKSGGTDITPVGRVVYCDEAVEKETFLCNNFTAALRPNAGKVFPKYLFYFMWYLHDSGRTNLMQNQTTGIRNLRLNQYLDTKLELPPLSEQRRIAAILDKIDSLIALRQQQLDKLDELVKARFVEMFDLENCPHASLISLVKEGAGLSYGIVQPGDDGTGTMGVLRPVDLNDGVISMASIKYIDRSIGDGYRKTELTGEELLITVRGTTGVTALTDERFKGMNVTRGIAVIRYDDDKVDPDYLNAFLKCEKSQRYIREHTRGATLQQINLSDLKMLEVALPKREEQEEYKEFSMRIFESKKLLQSSLTTLRTLKASLMQQYFS